MPKRPTGGPPNEPPGPGAPEREMRFTSSNDLTDPEKGPVLKRQLDNFAFSLAKDRDVANDLVSFAREKAVTNAAAQFTEGTDFRRWLFTIVRNRFYTLERGKRLRPLLSESFDMTEDEDPHDHGLTGVEQLTPEDVAEGRDQLEKVLQAMSDLPDDQRIVMELIMDGLNYEEIREATGYELGTIKSRISRAREKLRAASGREKPARRGKGEN